MRQLPQDYPLQLQDDLHAVLPVKKCKQIKAN